MSNQNQTLSLAGGVALKDNEVFTIKARRCKRLSLIHISEPTRH